LDFKTDCLVKVIIMPKKKAKAIVKIIAGIRVATLTKYVNQLSLPIKYAMKEITKPIFPVTLNEIIRTGTGASHSRYQ
jgi:hypothetical protein